LRRRLARSTVSSPSARRQGPPGRWPRPGGRGPGGSAARGAGTGGVSTRCCPLQEVLLRIEGDLNLLTATPDVSGQHGQLLQGLTSQQVEVDTVRRQIRNPLEIGQGLVGRPVASRARPVPGSRRPPGWSARNRFRSAMASSFRPRCAEPLPGYSGPRRSWGSPPGHGSGRRRPGVFLEEDPGHPPVAVGQEVVGAGLDDDAVVGHRLGIAVRPEQGTGPVEPGRQERGVHRRARSKLARAGASSPRSSAWSPWSVSSAGHRQAGWRRRPGCGRSSPARRRPGQEEREDQGETPPPGTAARHAYGPSDRAA